MQMEYPWLSLIVIGPLIFLGSLMDALAGGGGLITLPAYLIGGFTPHHAIATNKLSSSIGTCVSTGMMIKNKCIDWPTAIPSAVLAVLGSMAGAKLVLNIDERIIRYLLLIILPVVAFVVLRKRSLERDMTEPVDRRIMFAVVLSASFFVGMYDGFYGPGSGTFMLLAFTQLGGMDLRTASGNVKISNLSSNLGSLLIFLINGQVVIPIGLAAAVFGVAGHFIGARMLLKNGTKVVRPIILCVLALLFVRVVYDLVQGAQAFLYTTQAGRSA